MSVEHKTVGELVAADYRKAEVFKRFGIDFCCGGGRTVEEACEKKGIPYSALESELLKVDQENGSSDRRQTGQPAARSVATSKASLIV